MPKFVPSTTSSAVLRPSLIARLIDNVMSGPGVIDRRRPAAVKAIRVGRLGRNSMVVLESRRIVDPVYPAFEPMPIRSINGC
ncbi:hypothetical protein D3C87_2027080 [compost metagenome]